MKRSLKYLPVCLLILLFGKISNATHLIGGELYYECLSDGKYEIVLKAYLDCSSSNTVGTSFDAFANISIYDKDRNLIEVLEAPFESYIEVPMNLDNPCIQVPPDLCIQEGIYRIQTDLPNVLGGYYLAYERCCRNPSINNIIDAGTTGASYYAHIPGKEEIFRCNSSPYFGNFPPVVICNKEDFFFDMSAIDVDGDSVVYEFYTPLHGGEYTDPVPAIPVIQNTDIVWVNGFDADNPLASNPGMTLDRHTGAMFAHPTASGLFAVGVTAIEYRNGQEINRTLRDLQFTVTDCEPIVFAAIANEDVMCDGLTVDFENSSTDGAYFDWVFGDPTTEDDTSTLALPSYTYPDSGSYSVRLIVNPGYQCADTAEFKISVYGTLNISSKVSEDMCLDEAMFHFEGGGEYSDMAIFSWDFGDGSVPSTSANINPQDVSYISPGKKTVAFTISDRNGRCLETIEKEIEVFEEPLANIKPQTEFCVGLKQEFESTSVGEIDRYRWEFGDDSIESDTSILQKPIYEFLDTGTFIIHLFVETENGCVDSIEIPYRMYQPFDLDIDSLYDICVTGNQTSFVVDGDYSQSVTFNWNFGDAAQPATGVNDDHLVKYNSAGLKDITLTVQDHGGLCQLDTALFLEIYPQPVAGIEPQKDFCQGLTIQFGNSSTNALSYEWGFGEAAFEPNFLNYEENPLYTYSDTGVYQIQLIATYAGSCIDTAYSEVEVYKPITASYPNPGYQCITGNSFNFNALGGESKQASYVWTIPTASTGVKYYTSEIRNIVFADTGWQHIELYINDHTYCEDTFLDSVFIFPEPKIDFLLEDAKNCLGTAAQFENLSYSYTPATYLWDLGDGTTSDSIHAAHYYDKVGTYDVRLTMKTDSGCVRELTKFIPRALIVYPSPVANFTVYPEEQTIFTPDFDFVDLASGEIEMIFYLGDSDSTTSTQTNFSHSYEKTGDKWVVQYVVNEYGCIDTMSKKIHIIPQSLVYIPNAFTPNGDGINEFFQVITYETTNFEFYIFDRWGELLFYSEDSNLGWDGTHDGVMSQVDEYVYKVKMLDVKANTIVYRGKFHLIR